MKIIKISCVFLALGLAVASLTGCYEDKGNYKYTQVNEVDIELPAKNATILVGEPFSLSPTITSSMPGSENDYEYTWLVVLPYAYYETLLNGKDFVDWMPTLIPGSHEIVLQVKDTRTGIEYYSSTFVLTIQNPRGKGIALLTETDNLGKVELMALFNNEFVRYEAEGLPEMRNPSQLIYYHDMYSPYLGHTLGAAQRGALVAVSESGAYRVNPDDLSYDDRMNLMNMVLGTHPDGFRIEKIFPSPSRQTGYVTILGNDGNVYQYSYGGQSTLLWTIGLHYNTTQEGQTYQCAPWVFHSVMSGMITYNTEEGSFYKANDKTNVSTRYVELDPDPETQAPISKFTYTGRDLLWMQGRHSEGTAYNKAYALMCESESGGYDPNARYLVSFPITGDTYNEYDVTGAQDIRQGVDFCMTINSKAGTLSLLYYRTDTKIYAYDFNLSTTKVVYETTGGRVLTFMRMVQSRNYIDHLLVCTYDASNPTTGGRVEIYEPNSDGTGELMIAKYGEEDNMKPISFDGFARIVSADWKHQ